MKGKVLIIVTATKKLNLNNDQTIRTGYSLLELAKMIEELENSGFKTAIASPNGETPIMDKTVDEFEDNAQRTFYMKLLDNREDINLPLSLEDICEEKLFKYDGVYVVGGYGAIEDLCFNKTLGRILRHFHNNNKPTAVISHGACALLSKTEEDSEWIYKDYELTCYPKKEDIKNEKQLLGGLLKFYIEDSLKKEGANLKTSKKADYIIQCKELISAQKSEAVGILSATFINELSTYINNR